MAGQKSLRSAGTRGWAAPFSWSPADIATLQAWYRADTVVLDGSDNVTTWTNLKAGGNDLTGGTPPDWLSSVVGINNQPAVSFDSVASEYLIENASTRAANDHVLVVLDPETFTNDDYILDAADTVTGMGLRTLTSGSNHFGQRVVGNQNNASSWGLSNNTWYVLDALYSNTTSYIRYNFGTKATTGSNMTPNGNGLVVAAAGNALTPTNYSTCTIAEIIVSSGEIGDDDVANLKAYLNNRYGFSL